MKGIIRKKTALLACMLLVFLSQAAAKDNLAILPFTGGQGDDGETIAELFSYDARINAAFNPIPRTSIARAVNREQGFQMSSGMTDPDTIAAIGRQLGARYVVAGNIAALGSKKLLIISIMNIDNLQQIAGEFETYTNIEEIRAKLSRMAENIIKATQTDMSSLPKLAIVPVLLQGGADQQIADVLAQILSIYLIRNGSYAVYPRTSNLEQVEDEYKTQLSGVTADEHAVSIGRGENPRMVLSVAARRLGKTNMFNASIIDLETGAQVTGRSVDYENMSDGIDAMETLTRNLTSTTDEIRSRQQENRWAKAKFSGIGITAGSSFTAPWAIVSLGGAFSPLPYTFFDVSADVGFIHGYEKLQDVGYISLYPSTRINGYIPLGSAAGIYAGAGGGYMFVLYHTDDEDSTASFPVFDFGAGIYMGKKNHYFKLGYSLRTTFEAINHKFAVGYSYRFE